MCVSRVCSHNIFIPKNEMKFVIPIFSFSRLCHRIQFKYTSNQKNKTPSNEAHDLAKDTLLLLIDELVYHVAFVAFTSVALCGTRFLL